MVKISWPKRKSQAVSEVKEKKNELIFRVGEDDGNAGLCPLFIQLIEELIVEHRAAVGKKGTYVDR